MTFKLVPVFLVATLFLKSLLASPADGKVTPLKAVNVRFELLSIDLKGLLNLHEHFVENGTTFFEKVLADPSVTEVKTDAMKENIEKIQNLLNNLDKDQKGVDKKIVEIINDYDDIVKKFDKEQNDNLSEDEEIIANSLKKNGLEHFQAGVEAKLKETVETMSKKFNEYIEGLTEKEKKNEEEALFSWFDKLKAEKDTVKQFNIIRGYFKEFIDSSSESSE